MILTYVPPKMLALFNKTLTISRTKLAITLNIVQADCLEKSKEGRKVRSKENTPQNLASMSFYSCLWTRNLFTKS